MSNRFASLPEWRRPCGALKLDAAARQHRSLREAVRDGQRWVRA